MIDLGQGKSSHCLLGVNNACPTSCATRRSYTSSVAFSQLGNVRTLRATSKDAVSQVLCSTTRSSVASSFASVPFTPVLTVILICFVTHILNVL